MKRVILSLLVLALAAGGAWAQAPVVNAGWHAFVIREGATEDEASMHTPQPGLADQAVAFGSSSKRVSRLRPSSFE